MTTTDDDAETHTITIRGARAAAFRAIANKRNDDSPDMFGPLGHMPNLAVDIFEAGLLALAEHEVPDAGASLKREIEREKRASDLEAERIARLREDAARKSSRS